MATSRPTQADVARLAGVSRQTVSLVVLDDPRVSDQRRAAVQAAMEQLGYRPNVAARALAAARTRFVGIVLPDLGNPFNADMVEALRRHLETAGLVPFVAPVGDDRGDEAVAVARFLQMNVDGLVLVAPLSGDGEIASVGRQVSTVVVTRNVAADSVDLVRTDDYEGSRLVARHLVDTGYEHVVHLGPERGLPGDSPGVRRQGYRSVMAEAGREALAVEVDPRDVSPAVLDLLERYGPGTAFSCHNDLIALQVMGVLTDKGLEIGRDVGVAGFDNSTISGYPGISLTTVDLDIDQLARRTVESLEERTAGRTERVDVVVPPRLVPRRSSVPAFATS